MKKFDIVEVPFESSDTKPTLEDEFTLTAITRELESSNDPEKLRLAALNLLHVTMQRQAIIRTLCKKLAKAESDGIVRSTHEG